MRCPPDPCHLIHFTDVFVTDDKRLLKSKDRLVAGHTVGMMRFDPRHRRGGDNRFSDRSLLPAHGVDRCRTRSVLE